MTIQKLPKGFTLIEVTIVITIIAMLSTIFIPIYSQYIADAQETACLSEVKGYSNQVFYVLNDQVSITFSIEPNINACNFITNATGWTLRTQKKIIATVKPPSNARIECDIPNGTPCIVLP